MTCVLVEFILLMSACTKDGCFAHTHTHTHTLTRTRIHTHTHTHTHTHAHVYTLTHTHTHTHTHTQHTHTHTAFTELQTDLADLVQISDNKILPYRDFRSFAMRFLFPSSGTDHPVLNPLAIADVSEVVPHLENFKKLILNKKFLLLFVRTLESQQGRFSLQDK